MNHALINISSIINSSYNLMVTDVNAVIVGPKFPKVRVILSQCLSTRLKLYADMQYLNIFFLS